MILEIVTQNQNKNFGKARPFIQTKNWLQILILIGFPQQKWLPLLEAIFFS